MPRSDETGESDDDWQKPHLAFGTPRIATPPGSRRAGDHCTATWPCYAARQRCCVGVCRPGAEIFATRRHPSRPVTPDKGLALRTSCTDGGYRTLDRHSNWERTLASEMA